MRTSDAGTRWVAESAELTLRAAARLAELPLGRAGGSAVRALRDLCEQAVLWLEILEEECDPPTEREPAEAAAWIGRMSAGLAGRLRAAPAELSPEAARVAAACLSELERRGAWADGLVRLAERRGESERVHRLRRELPSLREFQVARRPARSGGAARSPPASRSPAG